MKASFHYTFKHSPSRDSDGEVKSAIEWINRRRKRLVQIVVGHYQEPSGSAEAHLSIYMKANLTGDSLHLSGTLEELAAFINEKLIGVPVLLEFIGHNRIFHERAFYDMLDTYRPVLAMRMELNTRVMFNYEGRYGAETVIGVIVATEHDTAFTLKGGARYNRDRCGNCWHILPAKGG